MMNIDRNRRDFLKTTALGTAAACLADTRLDAAVPDGAKSRVVRISDTRMLNSAEKVDPAAVKPAIAQALTDLTGSGSVKDAWMKIFPDLQASDIVGFKVNCINRYLSSHPEVVIPLAESLAESIDMNPNNIIIWDRTGRELDRSGYTLNSTGSGIRVMGTRDDSGYDDSRTITVNEGVTVRPSRLLSETCTYLVNIPVLKDHGLAGVTFSMKNHYGSIDNPNACHRGNCNPYIPNLNNDPLVKVKTRLIFGDAIQGIYDGGPHGSPQWAQNELIAGFDTVAVDYTAMILVDKKRKEMGLPYISPKAGYIKTAAEKGLGTNDVNQIDMRLVERG